VLDFTTQSSSSSGIGVLTDDPWESDVDLYSELLDLTHIPLADLRRNDTDVPRALAFVLSRCRLIKTQTSCSRDVGFD
jgi:hypothetical protein